MQRGDASQETGFSVCEECGSEKRLLHLAARERLHVQITVPEKIRSILSGGYESQVAYNLTIEGKPYTLNLRQKGFLQLGNVSYGIEPLESSIGFEHVIYQVEPKKRDALLYAEKDIELRDLKYKIQSVTPRQVVPYYAEIHIVVEKEMYEHIGADSAIVTQKIFQLIGLANAIFAPFNLTVILSSLEFWMDENKILTTGDANELLYRFLNWKQSYLVLRPHDMAFLLVYRETSDYVGATFQGKMCNKNYAGGVALHPRAVTLESLAIVLVQLLSLSMGITYDNASNCHCGVSICVMNPEAIHSSGVRTFSNCSTENFFNFISSPNSYCLRNKPQLQPSYKAAVCGNGELEEDEVCDCGPQNLESVHYLFQCKGPFEYSLHLSVYLPEADFGTNECYDELNSKTDISGNCGISPSGYKACAPNDRKCGKLICKYESENLIKIRAATIIYANISGHICISLEYAANHKDSNNMWVRDGTVCATNKVCMNKECVEVLNYDCSPADCNNHGVCNNKKHCHCTASYLPPDCVNMQDEWPGGSVDSGNQQRAESIPARHYVATAYRSKPTRWPFFLIIPFYIVICILIAILMDFHVIGRSYSESDHLVASVYSPKPQVHGCKGFQFQNWAKTYGCCPEMYYQPTSVEEVREVLALARQQNKRVKVVGGGHSPSDIACTDGFMIHMGKMNRVLQVDTKKKQVKVEAGILLADLHLQLDKHGLAMSNLGAVSDVTIAGVIGSGTHNTGIKHGILATQVVALTLMTADGTVLECSESSNVDVFQAARVHLGCLGIILTVTLQCVPQFHLQETSFPSTLKEVLDNLDSHLKKSEYFRFLWFPHSENVSIIYQDHTNKPPSSASSWFWDCAIGLYLLEFMLWISTYWPFLVGWINRFFFWLLFSHKKKSSNLSHKIFTYECRFKQHVQDWAIPREKTKEALLELKAMLEAHPHVVAHFPVEVRFTRGDEILLSPCFQRDSCYMNIIMYRLLGHVPPPAWASSLYSSTNSELTLNIYEDYVMEKSNPSQLRCPSRPYGKDVPRLDYWQAYETIMKKFGGRPHWAKAHNCTRKDFEKMYPAFRKFCDIREKLDPTGMFLNPYLEKVFY
ncbi:L-gulonolactone oxidase [Microtus ochrogaster]|uniref:L-gulonolactone oxidase n=1 Tax=Microtus ochrogaster TaxID=79684 RepID=A0A8J6GYD9_MICOH|nr:L-gulonolactone oxidase [Microtus ochrogaster]